MKERGDLSTTPLPCASWYAPAAVLERVVRANAKEGRELPQKLRDDILACPLPRGARPWEMAARPSFQFPSPSSRG